MYVHKPQVNGGSQGLLTALFMLGVVSYYLAIFLPKTE